MSTKFQEFLAEHATSSIFNGRGDETNDGMYYLLAAADLFFPMAARKLVEDGADPETVMGFLLNGAEAAFEQDRSPEERTYAMRTVREHVLRWQGHFKPYDGGRRMPKEAPPLERSPTQDRALAVVEQLCTTLRQEEGVSRKELYRALTIHVLKLLRAEGIDQELRDGLQMLFIDLSRDMADPHLQQYLDRYAA